MERNERDSIKNFGSNSANLNHLPSTGKMFKYAQRGFGRALVTRSASGQAATGNAAASNPGELNVLDNNLWLVNSSTPEARVVGFKWTPGLWARAKVESAETNAALFARVKSFDLTPRDLFNLTGLGATMWGAFIIGGFIGKWKLFGHRGQEPHHGHGLWTDTPAH